MHGFPDFAVFAVITSDWVLWSEVKDTTSDGCHLHRRLRAVGNAVRPFV